MIDIVEYTKRIKKVDGHYDKKGFKRMGHKAIGIRRNQIA